MRGDWEGQRGERVLLPRRPGLQHRGGGGGPSGGGGQGEGGAQD